MLEPHAANQALRQLVLSLQRRVRRRQAVADEALRAALSAARLEHLTARTRRGRSACAPRPPQRAWPSTRGARSTTRLVMAPTTRLVTLLATVLEVMSTSTCGQGGGGRTSTGGERGTAG